VLIVGMGFSWLRQFFPYLGAAMLKRKWCDSIGVGRIAIANPGFANELLANGRLNPNKLCITCSRCSQMMRDGVSSGCVTRDSEIYAPIYRMGRLKASKH
ncbi:MAG: NADH:flavin oxidoreductase, partial [Candidatus Aerophobetes bacterium]|nr:NADH:flavin oxidoreductase [Candidatus Aerophobetes bacterium]